MAASDDPEDRLRRFEAVTDTALAQLNAEQLFRELLERVRELLDVDTAVVLLHEASSRQLVATAAVGLDEEVYHGFRIPVGQGFLGRVTRQLEPVVMDRVDDTTVLNPLLGEKGLRVLLGAPMLAGGALVGVLHVGSCDYRHFTDHDKHLLQVVADRIALAAQTQVSNAERSAAAMLQRSLLSAQLPTVTGLQFAARYVPGARTGVGGDWYDVFELPSGLVGIVIGDVAGHGLPAAVVMGRLRSSLRSYALESDDSAEVLDKLDRKAIHFETEVMTTVAYGIVDPHRQRLQLSLAGHLPPVLATHDGNAAFLDVPVDPPIGILSQERRRRSGTVEIPSDSLLCFYTDGLIERRDRPLDDGLEELRRVIRVGPPEKMCAALMSACVGDQSAEDDIALLVMQQTDG